MQSKTEKSLSAKQLAFRDAYQGYLSRNTLKLYLNCIGNIENNTVETGAKASIWHYHTVVNKCKRIGVDIELPVDVQEIWERRCAVDRKAVPTQEITKFLKAIPNTKKGDELRLALNLAWRAGLRRREILGLTEDDISFQDSGIMVNVDGGQHILNRVVKVDRALKPYLTGFTGFSINEIYCNSTISKANFVANTNVNFGNLKTTFIRDAIQKGLSLEQLKTQIGTYSFASALHFIDSIQPKQAIVDDRQGWLFGGAHND